MRDASTGLGPGRPTLIPSEISVLHVERCLASERLRSSPREPKFGSVHLASAVAVLADRTGRRFLQKDFKSACDSAGFGIWQLRTGRRCSLTFCKNLHYRRGAALEWVSIFCEGHEPSAAINSSRLTGFAKNNGQTPPVRIDIQIMSRIS